MSNRATFSKVFNQIKVIRSPRHRLATFGDTQIDYTLVTNVTGYTDRSRLRIGKVMAERPALITPETLKNRFQGFGSEATRYADFLVSKYGQVLKGLEYQFKNNTDKMQIELMSPEKLATKLAKDFDQREPFRATLLRGNDKLWELSIMKFIVEETLASFTNNMQELNERGFFEGEDRHIQRKHREIRNLITQATKDPGLVSALEKKLREYKLFDQYQDEFFRLMRS